MTGFVSPLGVVVVVIQAAVKKLRKDWEAHKKVHEKYLAKAAALPQDGQSNGDAQAGGEAHEEGN